MKIFSFIKGIYDKQIKKILICICIFITQNCISQNTLNIEYLNANEFTQDKDFHLYKNDILIYKYCTDKENTLILNNLDKGKYTLEYNTIFGIESLEINLKKDNTTKNIELDYEKINPNKVEQSISLIENLKENDTLKIRFILSSCFNSNYNDINLIKKRGKTFELTSDGKQKKLNNKKIKKLIEFEKILKQINREENLEKTEYFVTCSEIIQFTKGNELLYAQVIYCGE